jgi:hypothetical protein
MQKIRQLGQVSWNIQEIKDAIPEFLDLYARKPIGDNQGGMKSPHMFATWFMLKKLNPSTVIESGIWKGQGTWLIENTLPNARIYSIDVNLGLREYISPKVTYFEKDFSAIDWSMIQDKENTLMFFDDHQNAFERIKQAKDFGFKHFIFEDNYPAKQGDCYSLKKAFMHAGFKPQLSLTKQVKALLKSIIKPQASNVVQPNSSDAAYLENVLQVYYEFPPIFKSENTRWNEKWNEEDYPSPEPVYTEVSADYLRMFQQEAIYYTWICYAKLK